MPMAGAPLVKRSRPLLNNRKKPAAFCGRLFVAVLDLRCLACFFKGGLDYGVKCVTCGGGG